MRPGSPRIAVAAALTLSLAVACGSLGCAGTRPTDRPIAPMLDVVETLERYRGLVEADAARELVRLDLEIPGLALDLRYATEDNFMGEALYPVAAAFLRAPAAEALGAVQEELAADGLGLKVFDAYRPYRVTVLMWEAVGDRRYVADPRQGSRHNRGAAVDVTLVELATGEEIPMPTAYDDFSERAHHGFEGLEPERERNRERLRIVMDRHGFDPLPTEWWHYDFRGWERFHLLDLGLEELLGASEAPVAP